MPVPPVSPPTCCTYQRFPDVFCQVPQADPLGEVALQHTFWAQWFFISHPHHSLIVHMEEEQLGREEPLDPQQESGVLVWISPSLLLMSRFSKAV